MILANLNNFIQSKLQIFGNKLVFCLVKTKLIIDLFFKDHKIKHNFFQ